MRDRAQRAVKAKLANGLVYVCPNQYCWTVAFVIEPRCHRCKSDGVPAELGVVIRDRPIECERIQA